MSRHIDADKIEYVRMFGQLFADKRDIDRIPTADVEPVRHGHWIWLENSSNVWIAKCSNCGLVEKYWKYCPRCGAKMDGEVK